MPTEIFLMIIRKYAIASASSVTLQRGSAMRFLLVCKWWAAIGQGWQYLFSRGISAFSGHDEIVQLINLFRSRQIPAGITNLTINLTPRYAGEGTGPMPAMVQVQQDLDAVRTLISKCWLMPREGKTSRLIPGEGKTHRWYWTTLNIKHFSLHVDLSAVSAQEAMFKGWTQHWVQRMGQEWREMEWKGEEGSSDSGVYSKWSHPDARSSPPPVKSFKRTCCQIFQKLQEENSRTEDQCIPPPPLNP